MGDLPRVMAQTDPTIERYGAEPDWTAIRSFFKDHPQADVMSLICAFAVRLFEGKLFLFSVIVERTDRCIVVGPVMYYAADDIFLATNKSDVQRIAGNAGAGACHHRKSRQTGFVLVVLPKRRQHEVSQYEIDD